MDNMKLTQIELEHLASQLEELKNDKAISYGGNLDQAIQEVIDFINDKLEVE